MPKPYKHGWGRERAVQRPVFTHSERRTVMRRDRYTCYACGTRRDWQFLEVDHRVPLAEGGVHSLDNAGTICKTPCHKDKSRAEAQRGFERRRKMMALPEDPHPFNAFAPEAPHATRSEEE